MADLRGEQLKDSYQNVVTRGTGNKLENGNGVEFADLDDKASLSIYSATKTDTHSEIVGGRPTQSGNIPDLIIELTPKSSNSKIKIDGFIVLGADLGSVFVHLYRNGTEIARGDVAGDRVRAHSSISTEDIDAGSAFPAPISFVDEPNTTSTITYSVRVSHSGSDDRTIYLNRSQNDDNVNFRRRFVSTITVMDLI